VDIPKISKRFETSLASSLSAAGTSFTTVSATDDDGNALSGLYALSIDVGNANVEDVIANVSGTTWTIVYRGIDADAPNTEVEDNKQAHRRGAPVVITDYPIIAILRNILNADDTLPNFLKYKTDIGNPTEDEHLVTKAYADSLVIGEGPIPNRIVVGGNAGQTISAAGKLVYFDDTDNEWKLSDADSAATVENVILGIAQGDGVDGGAIANGVLILGVDSNQSGLTTGAPYYASNTAGGISASAGTKEVTVGFAKSATELYFCPRFSLQLTKTQQVALANLAQAVLPYAADAGSTDTYAVTLSPVPTAYTNGMLVNFKANTVNTGAATLNVNGLGAKSIVKNYNLALANGDIKANMIVSVIYDGTNFQLLSPVTPGYASGVTTRVMDATSGAVTIAHGLGAAPRRIRFRGFFGTTDTSDAEQCQSEGTYDGTNTKCIYIARDVGNATLSGTNTTYILYLTTTNNGDNQVAAATFDATNITLTWTKNGSPPSVTAQILWEAFT